MRLGTNAADARVRVLDKMVANQYASVFLCALTLADVSRNAGADPSPQFLILAIEVPGHGGDGARRAECSYPPARCCYLRFQDGNIGCTCRLQRSPKNSILEGCFRGGLYTNRAHFLDVQFVPI
jgi:hypothetical protein